MANKSKAPEIPLPKAWGKHVKSAVLHMSPSPSTPYPLPKLGRRQHEPTRPAESRL